MLVCIEKKKKKTEVPLVLTVDLNHPNICLESKTVGYKQSRSFWHAKCQLFDVQIGWANYRTNPMGRLGGNPPKVEKDQYSWMRELQYG